MAKTHQLETAWAKAVDQLCEHLDEMYVSYDLAKLVDAAEKCQDKAEQPPTEEQCHWLLDENAEVELYFQRALEVGDTMWVPLVEFLNVTLS